MIRSVGFKIAVVVALAATAVGLLWQPNRAESNPPNVLIVLWDTVRADHLSMYGYDKPTTPQLKAWADQDALVFENALSPAMWTVPSHASMFTGLMPTTHGAGYDWRWLNDHNVTLAEWFGQHGWSTYAFSANPNLSPSRVNLVQGFDTVEISWGRRWKKRVAKNTRRKLLKDDRSTEISPGYEGERKAAFSYNAGHVTEQALLGWLDRREAKDQPWFAYLNYMEAHKPRVPTLADRRALSDEETIQLGLATDLTLRSQLEYSYGLKEYSDDELDAVVAVYDASLRELDGITAKLFEALRQRGELENTIVVFTSDHGENLGEHDLFGHRHGVYQQLVHVPLILSYPGVIEPGRVSDRVSNVNLYNTLCRLAGLDTPETGLSKGDFMDATKRVLQAVFTQSISVDRMGWEKIQQWHPGQFEEDPRGHRFLSVLHGDHKLIDPDGEQNELYNLAEDPHEEHNLINASPEVRADLEAKIAEWRETIAPYDRSLVNDGEGPKVDSKAMKEQLKLLGYLSDDDE